MNDDEVLDDLLKGLPGRAPDSRRAARLRERCRQELMRRKAGEPGRDRQSLRRWTIVESMSLALATAYLAAAVLVVLRLAGL